MQKFESSDYGTLMPQEHIDLYDWLLDIKRLVTVRYLFRGNPLPTDRTAHTTAFDGPVLDPLVAMENNPNCKCICCARLIG